MSRFRAVLAFLAVVVALALAATQVDARPGGGGSFGSRGTRTYTAPPATRTAPTPAAPLERTMTQPARPSPGVTQPPLARPGFFNRPGFFGGLLTGLLGAGLLGLLFGNGLFGGLGGFPSALGLLLQVALIVIVARLIYGWWQRRNALAVAGGPSLRDAHGSPRAALGRGSFLGGGFGAQSAARPLTITPADYDTFERLLTEVTLAYGAADLGRLRRLATPEMLSYFSDDLAGYASRGLVSETGDVKLLQGDLAEAWQEGDADYATVAMRYRLADALVEHATGRIVEGSRSPQEITELWTFRRARGGEWLLSAIQQVR
jgi:predicted lipid-binding transport protein (Tim44 family)